jgi:hypothetical protein
LEPPKTAKIWAIEEDEEFELTFEVKCLIFS